MAAIDTILGVSALVGGAYIVVAYILPAIQGQTAPTQSDIDAYNDWFSGAFADPSLQTDTGLFGGIDWENEDEVELIKGILGVDDEEDSDSSSSSDSDTKKKTKRKLTSIEQKKADANKTNKSSRTAATNKADVKKYNDLFSKQFG